LSDQLEERDKLRNAKFAVTPEVKRTRSDHNTAPAPNGKVKTHRRWWTVTLSLILSDVVYGVLFWLVAYNVSLIAGAESVSNSIVFSVATFSIAAWVSLRALVGLYPGYGFSEAEELRRQTLSASATFLFTIIIIYTVVFQLGEVFPILAALLNVLERVVLAPFGRHLVKFALAKGGLWGKPVAILGAGQTGRQIVRTLQDEWQLGFKPVAVFDFQLTEEGGVVEDVPYGGTVTDALTLAHKSGIDTAIFAMPHVRRKYVGSFVDKASDHFQHVVVVPNVAGVIANAVKARDLGFAFGLEIKQNLLTPWARVTKRALDVLGVVVGGILISPLLLAIAILIKIDSAGPLFYRQKRLGTGGKHFCCWKFRTMHPDAQRLLTELLQNDPKKRAEWERDHKLRDDPRITRVGRYLRRLSLDELPQLWNVWRGEMSMIGPRPIIDEEVPRYRDAYDLYRRVSPGMSGLWQVSGRSETSYEQRVEMDTYYVRNWSVWLDVVILTRTVGAVIFSRGAV
jgi:Undecaprenyl-phosphate galactose phosphotransferase WbaP